MITHVHHLNFLVRNLDRAVAKYSAVIGRNPNDFQLDELSSRNVKIARIKLGQTWLVLIQPLGIEGVPAEHLKKHGEGFFLMSLGCEDLDNEATRIDSETELNFATQERQGLDGWRVRDLDPEPFFGTQIQLTQDDLHQGKFSDE